MEMLPCTITCSHHLEQLLEQSLDWRKMTFFEIKRILIRSESEYLDLEQFVKDSSATLSGLGNKAHRTNLAGWRQTNWCRWLADFGKYFSRKADAIFQEDLLFSCCGKKKNQYVYLETGRQGMHLATEAKKLSFSQAKSWHHVENWPHFKRVDKNDSISIAGFSYSSHVCVRKWFVFVKGNCFPPITPTCMLTPSLVVVVVVIARAAPR